MFSDLIVARDDDLSHQHASCRTARPAATAIATRRPVGRHRRTVRVQGTARAAVSLSVRRPPPGAPLAPAIPPPPSAQPKPHTALASNAYRPSSAVILSTFPKLVINFLSKYCVFVHTSRRTVSLLSADLPNRQSVRPLSARPHSVSIMEC